MGAVAAAVMTGEGPPSTPLVAHAGMDADLHRHDGAATASQRHRRLV
jgi:hypothetical protein